MRKVISDIKNSNSDINSPFFFLFTCVKNGRIYIKKLFNSLLNQTEFNFVHFIYDDGSDDPISDLVEEYKKAAPYLVVYECNKTNIGLNMSTKHCIEKCDSPYFIWIDCDNWVDKDFFKNLKNTARKNPNAIMIKTTLFTVLEDGTVFTDIDSFRRKKENNKKNQIKNFFMNCYPFGFSFFAIKKELLGDNFTMLDERFFSNDHQVICQVLFKKYPIVWSKKSVGYFLSHNNSEGHINLQHTKGTNLNERWYLKLLSLTSKDSYEELKKIYQSLHLYKNTIEYLEKKEYKKAFLTLMEKRRINKKSHLKKKYYCKYHNDIYWATKILLSYILKR